MQNPAKSPAKVVMHSLQIACNGVSFKDFGPHLLLLIGKQLATILNKHEIMHNSFWEQT